MLPPKTWKTVKQPYGSRTCGAAVAAMAVGKGIRYVLARVPERFYRDGQRWPKTRDLLGFLGNHGIHTGEIFEAVDQTTGMQVNRSSYCEDRFLFRDRPAILTVSSKAFCWHYVFWDGQHVRDPSPTEPDTTDLDQYGVFEVIPLVYVDERLQMRKKSPV